MFTYRSAVAVLFVSLCVIGGCRSEPAGHDSKPPAAVSRPSTRPAAVFSPDDLDVIEAVVHTEIGKHAGPGVLYFFLEVGGADPPAALSARFAGNVPPLLPSSQAEVGPGGVQHKSGGHGKILYVGKIVRNPDGSADVDGGYYEARLSASGETYHVERRAGKWTVTGDVLHWIS